MNDTVDLTPLKIDLPLTLEGSVVRLEPIRREHAELFCAIAKNDLEDIFRWFPYSMKTSHDVEKFVGKIFEEQERGESVAFATVERSSGRVIGSTRFMNIDRVNRRVEIGSTWIAPPRVRSMGLFSCRTQDRCAESEVAQRNPAHRSQRGRHAAPSRPYLDWPRAGFRVLQHSG
jgi:hypothetical protein